eukprot:scaffold49025_cov20-Tisochrysis_lutea.AAC.1
MRPSVECNLKPDTTTSCSPSLKRLQHKMIVHPVMCIVLRTRLACSIRWQGHAYSVQSLDSSQVKAEWNTHHDACPNLTGIPRKYAEQILIHRRQLPGSERQDSYRSRPVFDSKNLVEPNGA